MTDKEIDNLFKKRDIELSEAFNDSIFARLKAQDKELDDMFLEQSFILNSAFNDKVLEEARLDDFLSKPTIALSDSFSDKLFVEIENEKLRERKPNIWVFVSKVSAMAAVLLGGVFVASQYFAKDELIPTDSKIYAIAKENINLELDYFILEDEMNQLSAEIDSLEASLLELESYYATANI